MESLARITKAALAELRVDTQAGTLSKHKGAHDLAQIYTESAMPIQLQSESELAYKFQSESDERLIYGYIPNLGERNPILPKFATLLTCLLMGVKRQ